MSYGFVKAIDAEEALVKFKLTLSENGLIPFDFEFLKPYEEVEWENENDQKSFDKLYSEALKSEEVVFDSFYMYEKDE